MKHTTVDIDTAVERATDRLHDDTFEGEPAGPVFDEITLAVFSDAPYDYITPDCAEQDELLKEIHKQITEVFRTVSVYQSMPEHMADGATSINYDLSRLGLAIIKVAESRGLQYKGGKLVQEVEG